MSEIRVNNIIDEAGTGAPTFPNGAIVTGSLVATATTATNAQGLTGTPNITVGTVTGTDATFSGNLTVQGTTTTIDTAVTAVDSLAVDGQVTAGSIGIGTINPNSVLPLTIAGPYPGIQFKDTQGTTDFNLNADNNSFKIQTGVAGAGPVEKFLIDQHGTTKFKGPLTEKFHNDTGAGLTGDYTHDLITYGNVYWSVSNSTNPFTFNLRGSASVSLNDMMSVGESLSFLLTHSTNNASNYMTAFKLDGGTLTPGNHIWWQGGSAPSAAGTSGYDVYSFTVYKIGNQSFRAFASLTNHA